MGLAIKRNGEIWEPGSVLTHEADKDTVSSSISQTWTDQAIKCYMTKSDCATCVIPKGNYSFECQMYKVVPVLLENLGEPEVNRVEKLKPFLHD